MQGENTIQSLGWEDALEKKMATHYWNIPSILAWEIPWTEESGRIWSMRLQRVGHEWATELNWSLHEEPLRNTEMKCLWGGEREELAQQPGEGSVGSQVVGYVVRGGILTDWQVEAWLWWEPWE